MIKSFVLAAGVFLIAPFGHALPHKLVLSEKDTWETSRWQFENTGPVSGAAASLYLAKKAQLESQPKTCLLNVKNARARFEILRPWLAIVKLSCAQMAVVKNTSSLRELNSALVEVEAHPQWFVAGGYSSDMRQEYGKGLLLLAEVSYLDNSEMAWSAIEKLRSYEGWLNDGQRAKTYQIAGDLAQAKGNPRGAHSFFKRSLQFQWDRSLEEKVEKLRAALLLAKEPEEKTDKVATDASAEATPEELRLVQRIQEAGKRNDYLAMVSDSARLIRQFPGGRRADWAANQALRAYLKAAAGKGKKAENLKNKLLVQMKKSDGSRLNSWASSLVARGYYDDAAQLAEEGAEKLQGSKSATAILLLVAKAFVNAGNYEQAAKYFEQIIEKHAGTSEAGEAIFRQGLGFFRQEQYAKARENFRRYLVLPQHEDFELGAMYWLWRSEQQLGLPSATDRAQQLVTSYPLTYYGLRARAETNGKQLHWPKTETLPLTVELWLTSFEKQSFDRFRLLLQAGWLKEAQAELKTLPDPQNPQEMLLRAKLFGLAFDYYSAIQWAQKSWDQDPSLRQLKWLPVAFPQEFSSYIEVQSARYELEPQLVSALIKQESSFRTEAVSPARAMGLMQLMPGTARDVARYNRSGPVKLPEDMFEPETNIKFGTSYLKRMIRAFNGHIPLALAAYNVGIGNMRKFLQAREELSGLADRGTSNYKDEIWIDELPWDETSFYVKAILRNLLVYRMLAGNSVALADPIWQPLIAQNPPETK